MCSPRNGYLSGSRRPCFVDGVDVYTDDYLPSASVTVGDTSGELHTIVFGNAGP